MIDEKKNGLLAIISAIYFIVFLVFLSTLHTSGTKRKGDPHPTDFTLYYFNKNWCSCAVPTPPCAVRSRLGGVTGFFNPFSTNVSE